MPTTQDADPPRRRSWARTVAAGALVVVVVVTLVFATRDRAVEIPGDGPWSIGIGHPEGDISSCARDASVSSSLMTADLPSSATSFQMEDPATRDDVRRVLDCLDDHLTGGDVRVATVQRPTPTSRAHPPDP